MSCVNAVYGAEVATPRADSTSVIFRYGRRVLFGFPERRINRAEMACSGRLADLFLPGFAGLIDVFKLLHGYNRRPGGA